MVWEYLAQFWDKLVAVGDYSVAWFQGIGNAVAGALGQFFDTIFHNANDLIVFIGWLFSNIKAIFLFLLSPITYFFTFIKTFFATFNTTPPTPAFSYTFSPDVLAVFDAIPHFDVLKLVLGAIVIFFGGLGILKLLLHT